ncbi:MAG TPA: dipeptidase PepE [Thermoanaerobaculia bacterium]
MRLLLISSSVVHGYGYLDHAESELRAFLGTRRVAFVPFAQQNHEGYTARVRERLAKMNVEVVQVRGRAEIESAEAIFIGGGNTFRLLKRLYDEGLVEPIRDRVRNHGVPYIGSSAGTNVATVSIRTTNDMPIVYPPTFDALGFVPFQINPHYQDPDPNSTHKGETREERIREFLEENATPVVGLREGSMLRVEDGTITLIGDKPARIFRRGAEPEELPTGSRVEL